MSGQEAEGVPPGFVLFPVAGGFDEACGPLWIKADGDRLVGGFRVEDRHCNPLGICHGGRLASFCDVHMAIAAQFEHDFPTLILPTISLSLDYLGPTAKGSWVETRAEIAKVTRGMVFVSELVTADGQPVVRAHGIFKKPSPDAASAAPGRSTGAMLRELLSHGAASS